MTGQPRTNGLATWQITGVDATVKFSILVAQQWAELPTTAVLGCGMRIDGLVLY